jgi:hypothetical protein
MRRPNYMPRLVLAAFTGCLSSCAECDRAGCDALSQPAIQGETGIAGVVAALDDVVADGCQECPLAAANLQLWRTDSAITTEPAAAALVAARAPDVTEAVSERYSQALAPGSYLLCVRPNCVGLEITAGETVTVNIQRRNGPTGFFVGQINAQRLEQDFGFDVGY